MDDINPLISQYVLRESTPYLSGAYTLTAVLGPFGNMGWIQGLAYQTTENVTYGTTTPNVKSMIVHKANLIQNAGQAPIGQAPTSGIFTGVEDGCK